MTVSIVKVTFKKVYNREEVSVMTTKRPKINTYDMTVIAMFAAVITICSWISINVGPVPVTLQTFAIYSVVMLLGGRRGTFAMIVYLLLGFIGIPVFANFNTGSTVFFGPTCGYILGYLLSCVIYWVVADILLKKFTSKHSLVAICIKCAICIFGLAVVYVFGTVWFVEIYFKGDFGYKAALALCVTPFVIPDLIKIAVASTISYRIEKYVKK